MNKLVIGIGALVIIGAAAGYIYMKHKSAAATPDAASGTATGGPAPGSGGGTAPTAQGSNPNLSGQPLPGPASEPNKTVAGNFLSNLSGNVQSHQTVAGKALAIANPLNGFKAIGGLFKKRRH